MPPRTRSTWKPFTDPITGQRVALAIHGDRATFWDRRSGVEHDGCDRLADVSPDLDAFYCPVCSLSGRISGEWAVDVLRAHNVGRTGGGMSAQVDPGYKQYLVTIPATALNCPQDVQVLVREFDTGEIEADFRSPAQQSELWCPVGMLGGSVERA